MLLALKLFSLRRYFMWQHLLYPIVLFVSELFDLVLLSSLKGHLSISDNRHKEQGLHTRIPL